MLQELWKREDILELVTKNQIGQNALLYCFCASLLKINRFAFRFRATMPALSPRRQQRLGRLYDKRG
jgi:hypothetical protein